MLLFLLLSGSNYCLMFIYFQLFKSVSERGKFTRMFTEAQRMYSYGDVESSFLIYLLLAEMGFEVAQSNVAYLLEQGILISPLHIHVAYKISERQTLHCSQGSQ